MLISVHIKINAGSFFAALLLLLAFSCKKDTVTATRSNISHAETINVQAAHLVGRQQVITLPTGNRTYPTSQALLWVPEAYTGNNKSSKTYPLIFNLYGQGSCGTDITMLTRGSTMSAHIADGFNATAVNPVDKRNYAFFVCSPQCPTSWGWSAQQVNNMLSKLKQLYPIDTTRIYLTGFSCGGWGLWSCMTDNDNLTKQFAAIIPISAASSGHPDRLTNVGKYNIACLNICGDQDAFYPNAVKYTKIINSVRPPIPAKLNTLHLVKHNAWKYAYDSAWKTMDNINIYQWMLQYKRQ